MANLSDLNQQFIIDGDSGGGSISACTDVYTDVISSCSGTSSIILTGNTINLNGDVYSTSIFTNNIYSGSTNLLDIFITNDTYITGGTYNPTTGSLELVNNSGGTLSINGFSTGFTDTYVTGGTYSNGTATFTNNTGGIFNVTGFTEQSESYIKHWIVNQKIVKEDETIVISGDYVISGCSLSISGSSEILFSGNLSFKRVGQIFIGGNFLVIDSEIINDGMINIAGGLILSGSSNITGSGSIN